VKAARATFERQGYHGTNVSDISRRARVAYGTFYTYFPSKEDVFEEVVATLIDEMRTIAESEPPAGPNPADRIARSNRGYLRAYRANGRMMEVLEQVATFSPRLAEVRRQARRYWVTRSQEAITRWQERGLVDRSVDPYYAASALGSMVDRSAYLWLVLGEPFEEERAIEQLTALYCRALGLSPTPNLSTRSP
jgi:AcrR family transcriptional regulator